MAWYAAVLFAATVGLILVGAPASYLRDALYWVPLIAAANLTELSTLPELDLDSTLGSIVVVAAALLFPPSAVALFAVVGAVHGRELRGQASLVMSLFNRSMAALSGAAAAAAALLLYGWLGDDSWQIIPAALAAVVSYEIANTLLLACMLVVRRGQRWKVALRDAANPFPRFALNAAVSAMLSLLIVVLVRDVSRWAVVLVAFPFWLGHSAQRSAREAQDRADELTARLGELEMLNHLGSALLSVRSADRVAEVVGSVLPGAASLDLEGGSAAGGVAVPGTAAVLMLDAPTPPSAPVVEAVASLVGLTLTRLRVEEELATTERARTALTARILEEATHERSRIAMAVHDDVLPLFAAAQMQIDNAEMLLEMDRRDTAIEVVETATQGVSDGIRSLRDTLEALRESTLVPGTVADGVRRLLADLQVRTGIRTRLDVPDPMPPLPFAVELLAFETVRGCVANIEKHAEAASARVEFATGEGTLVVHMHDDGRGFDPVAIGDRSHGLALMRQRAELARGAFTVTSRPGGGTTVRLEVPTW